MEDGLGYERYAVQGGDWGASISARIAFDSPQTVAAVHVNAVSVLPVPGDLTEPPLSEWTVYLDSNNNGAWNSGEPQTTTRSNGWYRFIGLAPGTYTVREVLHLPGHDLLEVDVDGRKVLVPFVEQIVPIVDVAAGRIEVNDVEGLFGDAD